MTHGCLDLGLLLCCRFLLVCDGVLRVVCWDLGISTMVLHHIIGASLCNRVVGSIPYNRGYSEVAGLGSYGLSLYRIS